MEMRIMICRRDVFRGLAALTAGPAWAAGLLGLAGCGPDEGAPAIPLGKTKDEAQKESEQLPGIPVKDPRKK
jgi:hypothetical protein